MSRKRIVQLLEILIIVGQAIFPLLLTLPYRVYVYLSWEGAFRVSEGQLPFRDFGLPLGGMYWVIPGIFFKIFGAQVITLIKAQAFINILSGFAFRSILKTLKVPAGIRLAGILLYVLSFSFHNFWPWYNHSVIVFGFIALSLILKPITNNQIKYQWLRLLAGSFFTLVSIFTKQDGGGLIFLICSFLLLYNSWIEKKWINLFVYVGGTFLFLFLAIVVFSQYDFGYWFNHGQPPHNARISVADLVNGFLGESQWLKFYLFIICLLVLARFKDWKSLLYDKDYVIFLLLTLGILLMAAIIQVTSYVPDNGNIFFHSFAFVFIFSNLIPYLKIRTGAKWLTGVLCIGVLLWWSHICWNYLQRIVFKEEKSGAIRVSPTNENVVDMHNAVFPRKSDVIPQEQWVNSDLYSLRKIKMPETTLLGIHRILNMDIVKKNKKDLKVLNMSEITFMASEIPFTPQKGEREPLWHHLGVGMFNRELEMFKSRIANNYYDLVLFEYVPGLNNFFPFAIREALQLHYHQSDSFDAPRSATPGTIEVYIRK